MGREPDGAGLTTLSANARLVLFLRLIRWVEMTLWHGERRRLSREPDPYGLVVESIGADNIEAVEAGCG